MPNEYSQLLFSPFSPSIVQQYPEFPENFLEIPEVIPMANHPAIHREPKSPLGAQLKHT